MSARPLRAWDLGLYAVAMTLSIRWIAVAAAAGPASVPLWAAAMLGFMAPLVIATAELTSRFAGEGGLYAWARESLGPFAGFLCGWLYWTCNLPFFSATLYFIINVLAGALGPAAAPLVQDPLIFAAAAMALAAAVGALQLAGLDAGKWLANFGAAASLGLLAILLAAGAALAIRAGPATDFARASWAPPLDANGAALWATMVFAFGGPEALAFLKGDVKGGTRRILRVLAVVGVVLAGAYMLGTLAMLAILRPEEASRLSGLPDALRLSLGRLGLGAAAPAALLLLALSLLGSYSAWFGVAARLPFVIGVDHYFPAAFARRSPRTGAPVVAIGVQALAVMALVLLSQAGASIKAAYDFLISMSVLSYTLPFAFLFVTYLKVQGREPGPGAWAPPGGAGTARLIGAIGLAVTLSAIACTLFPSPDAADKLAAVAKLVVSSAVLIGGGAILYALAARGAAAVKEAPNA
ncbi:MAG: APC family permease [Caulobacteraceae bacterium]|nr:APC family permease [Caulobacteraceae bacterium]